MSEQLASTVKLLAQLVAFDTTSRESNLSLIEFIREYLQQHDLTGEVIYNTTATKANLLLRIGPEVAGGIMLSGHTDVVPVDGQVWQTPPFQLSALDGRYYGRGTADMKGFLACVLAMIPVARRLPLTKPLWLAFSYDEEVGCLGVHSLLERLVANPIKPALCLVGEPTEMQPVYGHKGKVALRCKVNGHACHSAYTPEGVNAINYAARLITFILKQDQQLATVTDSHFSPPFSTLHVGTISGGRALNIVPDYCQFDLELRYLPQSSPATVLQTIRDYAQHQLLPEMKQRQTATSIEFDELAAYPGLFTPPQAPWVKQLLDWTGKTQATTVAFGTEGGLFEQCEIPTLVCGPGSMAQGHKPDEFISESQLEQCLALLEKVMVYLCDEGAVVSAS